MALLVDMQTLRQNFVGKPEYYRPAGLVTEVVGLLGPISQTDLSLF